MTRKEKHTLTEVIVSIVLFIGVMALIHMTEIPQYCEFLLFAGIYLICGIQPLKKAAVNIAHGQIFDENFLMCIATIGAFIIGEYYEAVEVIVFYRVGELFESIAVGRSRRSVTELMDICPEKANVLRDGDVSTIPAEDVETGEIVVVRAGERIPLDGIVVKGTGSVDTSALTGESVPVATEEGSTVLSGCINLTGTLEIRVTKPSGESAAAKILELVEEASERKARIDSFITRFARYYTPAVVIGAVLLSLVPPLFTGYNFSEWVFRGLTFLIVSCPCALVISVPLTFFSGIGCASGHGILIKGSSFVEVLAKAETIVTDKTGTLTTGEFSVSEIKPQCISERELLRLAAYAETGSSHPIGKSICNAFGENPDYSLIKNQSEKAGFGVKAYVDGVEVLAGRKAYLEENGVHCHGKDDTAATVYVAGNGVYLGCIVLSDTIKDDAREAIYSLRKSGAQRIIMLTGDKKSPGEEVGRELGLDGVYAELLPEGKVECMRKLKTQTKGSLIYIGDGMNDAPVLAEADVGAAMGGLGSDAAIEAADVVIMDDKPSKLALGIKISRKTVRIARQNIVFALGVKAAVLVLSAVGLAGMELAVFADVGVSIIAILNAMRAGKAS